MVESKRETRREFLRKTALLGAGVAAGGVLAACGGGATKGSASGGKGGAGGNLETVHFLLDVTPYGKHVPWYVGQQKGFFADAGLKVTIDASEGSADNVAKIAAGAGDLGLADTGTMIVARGNSGVKIKETCMYHYKNLQCCLYNKQHPVADPKALEGKSVAGAPGDAAFVLMEALAKINHFDIDKVKQVPTPTPNHVSSVVTGAVDAATTYYTFFPALHQALGEDARAWLYADYGIDIYNNGIIATEDTLNEKGDMVKAFNEAFAKAVKWSVENPDEATNMFLNSAGGQAASFEIARAQFQIAIDHLLVPEVLDHGIGSMSAGKMKMTTDLINKYFDLKKPVAVDDVYTNDFAPTGVIPQV